MVRAAYCTFDELNPTSGAGLVCIHEIAALKKVCDDVTVISRPDIKGADKYDFNPFIYDYFASRVVPSNVDLLHLSCSPGLTILDHVRPKKYVVNVVAHDLANSVAEHELYYGAGSYQYKHNTDSYLHDTLLGHTVNADVVLCPSTSSAAWNRKNTAAKRVEVIPHGTEIPSTVALFPEIFRVGYLGAFGPDKGLPYLLQAWSSFYQGNNAELVFGGSCGKMFQPGGGAEHLVAGLPQFRTLGWVDNISDFYNSCAVYIQPSVTEGFGIEIIEAMAHGRPVIASSGAGGADAVRDGIDGFIVPPRDPVSIANRLTTLYNNPSATLMMGEKARERAMMYSWENVEHKYVNLYKDLLA
jgi:glycosyltransferase involved in cell wall biosynthesis